MKTGTTFATRDYREPVLSSFSENSLKETPFGTLALFIWLFGFLFVSAGILLDERSAGQGFEFLEEL